MNLKWIKAAETAAVAVLHKECHSFGLTFIKLPKSLHLQGGGEATEQPQSSPSPPDCLPGCLAAWPADVKDQFTQIPTFHAQKLHSISLTFHGLIAMRIVFILCGRGWEISTSGISATTGVTVEVKEIKFVVLKAVKNCIFRKPPATPHLSFLFQTRKPYACVLTDESTFCSKTGRIRSDLKLNVALLTFWLNDN